MLEYGIMMYAAGAVGLFTKRVVNLRNGHAVFRQGIFGSTYNVFLDKKITTQDTVILNRLVEEHVSHVGMYNNTKVTNDEFASGKHESLVLSSDLSCVSLGKPKKQINITDENKKLLDDFDLDMLNDAHKFRLDTYGPTDMTVLSTDKKFFIADKGLTNKGPLYSSLMFNAYNRPQLMLTSIWLTTFAYSSI